MRKPSAIVLVFILSFSMSTLMVSASNAVEDSWTSMAPLPVALSWRSLGAAVVNGAIYVFGEKG